MIKLPATGRAGAGQICYTGYKGRDLPMKKIGFITTNKVLAQSLADTIKNHPDWGFEPFLLLNPRQAALDAEVLKIDTAVVDAADSNETKRVCETLRQAVPGCRLLLLVPQDGKTGRKMAIQSIRSKAADDFVFYDASLDYLFAKLAAI